MKIIGIKSNVSEPKITSYIININGLNVLLDFGNRISEDVLKTIDVIFISHEHKDHIAGLLDSLLLINDNCKIILTKTTKLIITEMMNNDYNINKKERKISRFSKALELLYEEDFIYNNVIFRLYQAGHTYGSSMLYIEGEYKLLYTGDINFYSKYNALQYKCDNLEIDYLILDGTNLLMSDFKKQSITHLNKLAKEKNKFFVHARAEKAILIGQILALDDNINIYYEPDLMWYTNILYVQGYSPCLMFKINFDKEKLYEKKDGVFISSSLFEKFNKECNIGLHISNDDLNDFIYKFNNPKILVGHYRLSSYEEIKNKTEYYLIKEGENIV